MDDGPALEELFAHLSVTADWTMGFLTALATGPDVVASEAWLPKILPEAAEEDAATRKRCELLVRLYGAAAETLAFRAEIIPPEADKPVEDVVEFCRGYLSGAAMHAAWQSDASALEKLAPITAVANGNDAERDKLGSLVAQLRDHFKAKRTVVNTSKVGRNDPCPCGSGKKSKKCCAA